MQRTYTNVPEPRYVAVAQQLMVDGEQVDSSKFLTLAKAVETFVERKKVTDEFVHVYATDRNGTTQLVPIRAANIPSTLAHRNAGGQIAISDPTSPSHAATKNYVDKTHYGYSGNDLLIIPDGTTTIADEAYYSTRYKYVAIPDSVTSIGKQAFDYCTKLTSVTIPNSVTSIGELAFDYCTKLTSVTIPNSVTSIGELAFAYCTKLTNVVIGNGIPRIYSATFSHCDALKEIDLTEFEAGINFPTLDSNNFESHADDFQIKVPIGRKAELAAMTNWSVYADNIVEVPTLASLQAEIEALKNSNGGN